MYGTVVDPFLLDVFKISTIIAEECVRSVLLMWVIRYFPNACDKLLEEWEEYSLRLVVCAITSRCCNDCNDTCRLVMTVFPLRRVQMDFTGVRCAFKPAGF